jgi:hypothetical protein
MRAGQASRRSPSSTVLFNKLHRLPLKPEHRLKA